MKVRIAVVSRMDPAWGGSFQYGFTLLEAMAGLLPERYDVVFFYSNKAWSEIVAHFPFAHAFVPKQGMLRRTLRKIARGINKFIENDVVADWVDADAVVDAVVRWNPDVCISLEQAYNPLPAQVRVVGPVHDLMHRYETSFPEVGETGEFAARERLFSKFVSQASAIMVDSRVGSVHVREVYGAREDKVHVLPFVASPLLATEASRPEGMACVKGQFVFYPAQFWLHKNHVAVVRAIELLPDLLPLHCVFVGDTNKSGFAAVLQEIQQRGLSERVHIFGYVSSEEVAWLYKNAFALVMPTFFGPTSIPPLEAFHYGCPAIVSDVYGVPEQLGDAALYVDPKKPEQIAEHLCRLAGDARFRSNLIARGHQRAKQWTKRDFQKRFLEIVVNVAG